MMNIWTAAVIIVAIIAVSSMFSARMRTDKRSSENLFKALDKRVTELEKRMANIETIILESERKKDFSDL